jgi:hypothetical protein
VEKTFQYRGDLAQTGLPEILYSIDRFRVPGVIEARRPDPEGGAPVEKRVWIKDGSVVHAASSDRQDSLGAFLRRTGRLADEALAATMKARETSNKRYGVLLVERGLLSPRQVYDAIREQIEEIVWSLFYWERGEVSFRVGEFRAEDMVQIHLPMRRVILEGIKRAPNARALVARLGDRESVFLPSFRGEDLIEIGLDADDGRLLGLVDGQRTLYDLCAAGPHDASDNAKLVYAFVVLQLVRRRDAKNQSGAVKIRFKTAGDTYSG